MRIVDIIQKKRDGLSLTKAEIVTLIDQYTKNEIPDYQMAAWLMAVFLKGMTSEETANLTMVMANSGKILNLASIPGIKVDKHSTGGVADTTTLVLVPLVAAAGVPVAKMSGRGLGFTGGTIDKLDAIPGMSSTLTEEEFIENIKKHNLAVIGQTPDIAPADGKIYAMRDVTGTIESIPLIASSIMSKKIAAGADKILLDVKVGSGAFMKDLASAIELAQAMVEIGELVGRQTIAVISSMEEPLGQGVGNSLEVEEAIDILAGKGSLELKQVCLTLGAHMLVMVGVIKDFIAGYNRLQELIDNKEGLQKFKEFVVAQGGNPDIVDNRSLLPQAKHSLLIKNTHKGYISKIDAGLIGYYAMQLGAGREFKGQQIDLAAGIQLQCRVSDFVEENQPLATLYANDLLKLTKVAEVLLSAITVTDNPVPKNKLILGVVDVKGFHKNS